MTQPLDLSLAGLAAPLAAVVRGPLVESVHLGHLVITGPDGEAVSGLGDPHVRVWPRSSLKPLQAVAALQAGLDLSDDDDRSRRLLALACASHSGEQRHLDGVLELLAAAGLGPSSLRNTPDLPYGAQAAAAWRAAGNGPQPLAQNCSGKHAAMLAACVAAGWDTGTYLDVGHPLQRQVRATVADLGSSAHNLTTVDGCGAPLHSLPLSGLARAFGRIAAAPEQAPGSPEAAVARAMSTHPEMVGGTGRDVTALMAGVPGLVAKDGAEGVYAAGLPDGRGVALKVLDGGDRPRPVVLAAVLRALGVEAAVLDEVGRVPVLGHGRPVGAVRAVLPQVLPAAPSPPARALPDGLL
ncbi:asparaginase [Quadrisphaera granulorum]|uniref:Asparaginase n=1 Tax=Quadrisphaera granulorum TaxID=317664 RepID=A0A316A2D5_9ACTN|nr:asparaginase [Quadrisphaera granulorum]PWJ51753.1 asparaginase [Quadrisphaera granulorum]SZE97700.1 asparaginase [Quadrisphaera granulorum]